MITKQLHPFDLYTILQRPGACADVVRIGREKVTVAVAGHKPYSYWAEVYLIEGQARTITTMVDCVLPESKETFADHILRAKKFNWPSTDVSFSDFEPAAAAISIPTPRDIIQQRLITVLIIALLGFSLGVVTGLAIRWPF